MTNVVLILSDNNRRYRVVDVKTYELIHVSGTFKTMENCLKHAYGKYDTVNDYSIVLIVHT